jgi:glutamine synthetase
MGVVLSKKKLTSFQIIIMGFSSVILLGTLLLMLPISSKTGGFTSFADALFTSTSAVCVTGLIVFDTATYWSLFGQFVIMLLIEIGGMGVITVAASFAMIAGRKISLMQRSTMQEAIAAPKVGGIVRKDLQFTGRTLFGARPPKGQEMDDHYFGVIKPRVEAYMADLNEELWKLGILAKTQHNEVAPAQHELAPIYTTTNIATDHNQLTMEIMQKVAARHGLVCLLHEKPFAGVNGSGKHNNWSISTDTGVNLLSPGETPYENAQFLLFLCAVIKAVDDYQDLLRLSVATAGNDHRLGANEAPPAVVSMFLGDELNGVLEAIEKDIPYEGAEKTQMKLGVDVLPKFNRDTTDRNRTSPFAFTGNKFEFRMLGSSNSIACANMMLNSAVAESLKIYADRLEKAENFEETLHAMIRKTIKDHKRIIFNGNGYDDAWIKEATEKRGLMNYPSTPDCMPHLLDEKNVRMLTSHKVFSKAELESRCEIMLENYCKTIVIEANTMVDMVKREIIPAVEAYAMELARTASAKKRVDETLACRYESGLIKKLSTLTDQMAVRTDALETALIELQDVKDIVAQSYQIRDTVLTRMQELRIACDEAETVTAKKYWPFPTYGDLLFSVK